MDTVTIRDNPNAAKYMIEEQEKKIASQQERINDLATKVTILYDAMKLIAESNGSGWEVKQYIAKTTIEKMTYYERLMGHGGGV